jgi:hypothetical protein
VSGTNDELHPRTREVLAHLDEQRAALREAIESVPPELRTRRPAVDRWSVAEVIEHLATVEARIATLLARLLEEGRARGLDVERESSPVVSAKEVAMIRDRTRTIVAAESLQPKGATDAEAAWQALQLTRASLRATILAGDGLDVATLVAPHRVLGPIDWYRWLVFVGAHETRHAEQIRETAAALVA